MSHAPSSRSTPRPAPPPEVSAVEVRPSQPFALANWMRHLFGAGAAATAGGMASAALAAKDLSPEQLRALKELGPPILALLVVVWAFASFLKLQHDAEEQERARTERRFIAMEANFQLALDKVLARHERTEGRVDGLSSQVGALRDRLDATAPHGRA